MKIYINNKMFYLPNTTNMEGSSGKVYRVIDNDDDLAVKIYHPETEINLDWVSEWYPNEEDLNHFIECYKDDIPVLLSKYKVVSHDNKYIGCATDYIEETRGNSYTAIKNLPIDLLFTYLYDIQQTISYFNRKKIVLCDWQLDNIKLGIVKGNNNERLYIFDDSNYWVEDNPNNENEFNNLIKDITYTYFSEFNHNIGNSLINKIEDSSQPITILERITKGYSSLNEFFKDYAKIYQKKKG